ncbi:hypothetical protein [Nocardioides sp. MH1]|uniref:hypothetical protein n=1 Tax=Nocardioides sp. MH1 TaxID=3242490 RepID=UPI00352116E3
MARRRMTVRTSFVIAILLVVSTLAACSSDHTPDPSRSGAGTTLSQDEIAKAEAVARRVIAEQGASVSSASVIGRQGKIESSNTGHVCASGRELLIRLIGTFPNTVTTGHLVPPGSPTPDFTVRAMNITVDAESGQECLIGVQTGENGEVKALPGATALSIS